MTVTHIRSRSGDFERTPPHDIGAEQCVIGGMLLSADAIADVTQIIKPCDHYRPAHQVIHEVILALWERSEPVDPVTVGNALAKQSDLTRVGGGPYLVECMAAVPSAANAGYYARIVREQSILRQMVMAGTRIVQLAYEGDGEAVELAARAQQMTEDLTAPAREDGLRPMSALMEQVVASLEQEAERGLPTGLSDLDEVLTGLAPGQLILVAARPSVGKSVLTTGIAAHVAMNLGLPVLLSSLEMTAEEITLRLISSRARVPLSSLLQRKVAEADWDKISKYYDEIATSPLVIDDTPECTLAHIRAQLREMARTNPARLLVVDYLGLLTAPKSANREAEIAGLSRGLKLIARTFGIPVVAAAQLNRMPEHRADKRPVPSDLRDSGAQEQDADVIILLHREDMYDRESPRAGEIDLDVGKNRQGPKTCITAAFQGHYARCVGMAPADAGWSPSAVLRGQQ